MSMHVHIVNHTHWDREWFLTSEYTSRWIPGLIRSLERRVNNRPEYRYLLDGQTLVVEDMLKVAPDLKPGLQSLVEKGHLTIGPYYSQPDWQLASGELLIRNLLYGISDVRQFRGVLGVGWLVDTFGHISQAPQIHGLFGLDAIFVWRGVPKLVPYFSWKGADGHPILTINLFGGYRNLYGVTHVPEVATNRLMAEVRRLAPYYPTPDIPLFDGYDLENDPEDPVEFYTERQDHNADLELHEATPLSFASLISEKNLDLPEICGELNSGKFGATFPGVFSARTYLKIMAYDCQELLYQRCEPLASLASLYGKTYPAERFERLGRLLLQNGVHDCICGVSIDPVHEKMDWSYQEIFQELSEIMRASLSMLLSDFATGEYAVSTNPFRAEHWVPVGDHLLHSKTEGIGIWPILEKYPIELSSSMPEMGSRFIWSNDHYQACLHQDGLLHIGDAVLGELRVYREKGDTYSDERGELLGVLRPTKPPVIVEKSAYHTIIEFGCSWQGESAWVSARLQVIFDPSPLVRWQIDLNSRGADLVVEMSFTTARQGNIWAGMPFDLVERDEADADLLPRQPAPELASILLGQRELGEVRTYPFHELVAIADQHFASAVFARGLHSYWAEAGTISLPLRRSVEWLTRADLESRVGDAGPFFYVPDARCERNVHHELAFAQVDYPANALELQSLNASFHNPPLFVKSASSGTRQAWKVLQENLPLSSLQIQDGVLLARFYNPTSQPAVLSQAYRETDVWGQVLGATTEIAPKKIASVLLSTSREFVDATGGQIEAQISILNPPSWRVGPNQGIPDPEVLLLLEKKIELLDEELEQVRALIAPLITADDVDRSSRLRLEHRMVVLQRERLEYRLSSLLNTRKLELGSNLLPETIFKMDPEIVAIGKQLNDLRIKRRIYDYVVQVLE